MCFNTFEHSIHYLNEHWSIFPVFAEIRPEFAKHPAVRWQIYQTRPPHKSELEGWFITNGLTGIAIVTGNLSRLVVLDFDSPQLYDEFCAKHPHLAQSYTVNTKRGKHIYYSLIPTLHAPPTIHGAGIDLQSEGAYVVAPPTTIAGFTYTVAKQAPLHQLIPAEVALIQAYIKINRIQQPTKPILPTITTQPYMTLERLERLYLDSLHMGRNNALFWVSCLARDYGISQAQFTAQLVNTHASRPATNRQHHHETHATRIKEAQTTIASAYSHPPRPIKPHNPLTPQLPNCLREAMLQIGMMGVIRTIEALRLAGIAPNTQFTASEAITHTSGTVGRDTVRHALNATAPIGGTSLFKSPRTPLVPNGIAIENNLLVTNSCELVTVKKSGKNGKGRPSALYTMPSNDDLIALFGIKPTKQADPLTLDDLKNVRKVRLALHQRFLTRVPGRWAIRTFASRLGVTTRTIRNYHRIDTNFRCIPLHNSALVRWSGINDLFGEEFPHKGYFLTDSADKKYPAKAGIAKILLAKRQTVQLHERIPNFWWYGADMPPISAKYPADVRRAVDDIHREKFAHTRYLHRETHFADEKGGDVAPVVDVNQPILNASFTPPTLIAPAWDIASHRAVHQPPLIKGMPKLSPTMPITNTAPKRLNPDFLERNRFRRAFADESQEALTIRLQKAINARAVDKEGKITRESARRLVHRYSQGGIEEAIRTLNTRQNIQKPAGFISTFLRGYKKG
jgi:hypothetical protein